MPPCNKGSETLSPTNPPIDSTSATIIEACTPSASTVDEAAEDRADQEMHPASQIAGRALADPGAINIDDELDAALHQSGADIDGAELDDPPKIPVLDEIVDDPALQFERHDFEQKHQTVSTTRTRWCQPLVART